MRHKHADLIHAWAEGAQIQSRADGGYWEDRDYPSWSPDWEYRIKPEPKPDIVLYPSFVFDYLTNEDKWFTGNKLKITFDGETKELKGAEVL